MHANQVLLEFLCLLFIQSSTKCPKQHYGDFQVIQIWIMQTKQESNIEKRNQTAHLLHVAAGPFEFMCN